MRLLAKCKFLRATPFDPFGYTAERKEERALIVRYEMLVRKLLMHTTTENVAIALLLLRIPEGIRGYGYIKTKSVQKAKEKAAGVLS